MKIDYQLLSPLMRSYSGSPTSLAGGAWTQIARLLTEPTIFYIDYSATKYKAEKLPPPDMAHMWLGMNLKLLAYSSSTLYVSFLT